MRATTELTAMHSAIYRGGAVTRRVTGLAVLLTLAFAMLAASSAQATLVYVSSFGHTGTDGGGFSEFEQGPGGIAVNQSNGHVYVTDPGQNRVQEFDASGDFISMFGQDVDETTGGEVCTAISGDTCKAGAVGGAAGAFNQPQGIAVDQSNGDLYVQDANNNRIEKFTSSGTFILTWGKGVDSNTHGDICTAASGHTCVPGGISGSEKTTPPTPSANGVFAGWEQATGPGVATDPAGFVYVSDPRAVPNARVQKFSPDGTFVSQIAANQVDFFDRGLNFPTGLAVAPDGDVFVMDEQLVKQFEPADFSSNGLSAAYDNVYDRPTDVFQGVRQVTVDPSNGFLFSAGELQSPCPENGPSGSYRIDEFHPSGQQIDCTVPTSPSISNSFFTEAGMAVSTTHKLYVGDRGADAIRIYDAPVATPPTIGEESVTDITSKSARLTTDIRANLGDTTYHIEYGTSPCPAGCTSTPESEDIGAAFFKVDLDNLLEELSPGTTYYYRYVATNSAGTVDGTEHKFATFPSPTVDNSCPNNLARQQTRSALLLDCRAYELVSAEDTGGYNVESDIVGGQEPYGGYPEADGRVLYAVHDGGIPGTGKPTNRGPDPYIATRDAANERWDTKYVGIPADAPSTEPFTSTLSGADSGLDTLAFGGPDICAPCFGDGSAGMPVRKPDGSLVQGMAGSKPVMDPVPAGIVKKSVSADGSHFIFGSLQQFEPEGNESGTDVTIYSRALAAGSTEVVSTLPDGSTIEDGEEVAELDVSADGRRVLIGELLGEDEEGNRYWHLYMHIAGSEESIDLMPGASVGALYDGMTSDGSMVYFTTTEALSGDTDTSADIYRAEVSPASATVARVSTGSGAGNTDSCDPGANSYNPDNWNVIPGGPTDCSVVALGGGGGVAPETGRIYFLSPEELDGQGEEGAPNLFYADPGSSPVFVTTLESSNSKPLPPPGHVYEGSFGTFSHTVSGAAVDNASGDVYVFDTNGGLLEPVGYVQKFDREGHPISSWASGGKVSGITTVGEGALVGQPGGFPSGIAIDNNPASPNYRDIWVPDEAGTVNRYDGVTGSLEDTITVGSAFSPPMAVAVNPATNGIYVLESSIFGGAGTVWTYDSEGNPVAPTSFSVSGHGYGIAVSAAGKVYVANGENVSTYSLTGTPEGTLDANPALGVVTDFEGDHTFVDEGDRVKEFDSTGTQVGPDVGLGDFSESRSLGVASGRIAVSDPSTGQVALFSGLSTPPDRGYDNPLVIDSVRAAETRKPAEFQTNTSGDDAVLESVLPLTGFESGGKYNLYRYDVPGEALACVSCNTTLAKPTTDASLASGGLSITDDGRVFFTSGEPLVLRDNNDQKDAYEWENGHVELISSGKDSFDSGLLTASSDGRDAFFFTRETLTTNDRNGTLMKIYDARSGGGFFTIPPAPACAASDECHGPSTQPPAPASLGTLEGTKGNVVKPKSCKKGFVKKKGKCVKKKPNHKKKHGKRHKAHRHG